MSSPENVDPAEEMNGSSASPAEREEPKKTRYGRVIIPKGDLPGESEIPKIRMKKKVKPLEVPTIPRSKPEEPQIRPKRKYTKRKIRDSNEKDETAVNIVKIVKPKENIKTKPVEVIIKEEEPEEYEQVESDGEQYDDNNRPPAFPNYNKLAVATDVKESCDLCGMVMEAYKIELHKLDSHPEHAPYECLSCRIRSFFDYWSLKEHYKLCSNGRIGCEKEVNQRQAPINRGEEKDGVIEADFFRKCYQPVECPYCRIYLASYFDLDVHFTSHGLAAFDAKFACEGCNGTFISVEALKKHLTRQNTPRQSLKCFNTSRVLNMREIEKLKERYTDSDRKECIRKFDLDTYVLAAPKILENAHEAICAYCDEPTRAYAHIKPDLSNLIIYGLECDEKTKEEIAEKISHCREKQNGRVCICRHHFQWRNWQTKRESLHKVVNRGNKTKTIEKETSVSPKRLAQKVIRRIERTIVKEEDEHRIAITRGDCHQAHMNEPTSIGAQFYPGNRPKVKIEEEDDYEEQVFEKKEIKKEEPYWDEEGCSQDMSGQMDHYDVIDISDDDFESPGEGGPIAEGLNKDALEEKVAASMRIGHSCPACQEMFSNLTDLHSHQANHPGMRLLYACADCPEKSFLHPDEISKHFDEKMKSALAGFYSYKVNVHFDDSSNVKLR